MRTPDCPKVKTKVTLEVNDRKANVTIRAVSSHYTPTTKRTVFPGFSIVDCIPEVDDFEVCSMSPVDNGDWTEADEEKFYTAIQEDPAKFAKCLDALNEELQKDKKEK